MREELIMSFPSLAEKELSDEYILNHTDLMWDIPDIPLIKAVPLYMLWCIDNSTNEGELVFDNTIRALNNYARAKDPENETINFRHSLTSEQVKTVINFLFWCDKNLMLDYEPTLSRAIKNWQNVGKCRQMKAKHLTSSGNGLVKLSLVLLNPSKTSASLTHRCARR